MTPAESLSRQEIDAFLRALGQDRAEEMGQRNGAPANSSCT